MTRHPHRCAFILGTAFILLAAILVLRVPGASDHPRPANAAHLAQAVARLDGGCAICHRPDAAVLPPISGQAGVLVRAVSAETISAQAVAQQSTAAFWPDLPVVAAAPTPDTTSSQPDGALLDLGWRMLRLPEREQARAGEVIETYVALVDATRPDGAAPVGALMSDQHARWQISRLAAWIEALEQRAQPIQWDQQSVASCAPVSAALHHGPLTPPLSIDLPPRWIIAQAVSWVVSEPPDLGLAYEVIFGTQRRGPPADAALASILDSVLGMRDCAASSGSLSFLYSEHPSTQQQRARRSAVHQADWTPVQWITLSFYLKGVL